MAFWTDRLHWPVAVLGLNARLPVAYLATCLLFLIPLAFQGPAQPGAQMVSAVMDDGRGGWHKADVQALTLPQGRVSILKMVMRVDPTTIASGEPLGLYLSGTFSAAAAWNGVTIGEKGRPGDSRANEQPGLVDDVLPLPARLLRPGENDLTLRLSANYLVHPVHTVIHGHGALFGLRVSPFSAEARRPIGYYAAPFLMSAVLLMGLLALLLRGEIRSSGGAILGGLLTAALAEISRSVVNYPYPLHDLRLVPITLAIIVTAAAILLHASKIAGLSVGPRLRRGFLLAAAAVATVSALRLVPDEYVLAAAAAAGAIIAAWGTLKKRPGGSELCAALCLMTALGCLDLVNFMDCGVYAAAAPLAAYLVWPRRKKLEVQQPPAPGTEAAGGRLSVGPADDRRFIPLADLRAIHGAGDYAELRLKNGERVLHLETLQTLAARLPHRFFRTHRSHIVNLDHVQALTAAGGGRYKVQLSDGDWMPVSRTRVAELRQRLVR